MKILRIIFIVGFLFPGVVVSAKEVDSLELNKKSTNTFSRVNYELKFHNDSIHKFNFKYPDRKRGIKPFIAPTLLITTGTALHFSTDAKQHFQSWMQNNFAYNGHIDDYLQYAPLAAVYSLNLIGVKGKNNYGNLTALALKSILLNIR